MQKKTYFLVALQLVFTVTQAQLTLQQLSINYNNTFTCNNIQLVPIYYKAPVVTSLPNNVVSLTQAMEQKKISINEFYYLQEANVQILSIKNKSNNYIWIEPGTILKGGKQDRMVVSSKLIEPKATLDFIDVFCIEKKRWDKRAKNFTPNGLIDRWMLQYTDSVHAQKAIWNAIEERLQLPDSIVPTRAYLQTNIATAIDSVCLAKATNFLQADSSMAGFIAITDSTIIGGEVFINNNLLYKFAKSIVEGYIKASLYKGNTPILPKEKIQQFAQQWLGNVETQNKFLQKHGKAFYYNNKVFHIIAFKYY
jgi:hypothetical protein